MTHERPTKEIKLGRVKATIWPHRTEAGCRFNVTVCRVYKDGDQWKTSDSFGREELPLVIKALDMAHTWMLTEGSNLRSETSDELFYQAIGARS